MGIEAVEIQLPEQSEKSESQSSSRHAPEAKQEEKQEEDAIAVIHNSGDDGDLAKSHSGEKPFEHGSIELRLRSSSPKKQEIVTLKKCVLHMQHNCSFL